MAKAKEALISAFLKLIEKEDYEKISVTNLVSLCGISRQTFYYHFNDIDEMLEWAFKEETRKICEAQNINKWRDSAEQFIGFFQKYDTLLRKGIYSPHFVFLYNLIYDCFYTYIKSFIEKRQSPKELSEETLFLISLTASSYCGLVVKTLQKENRNYEALLNQIASSFKSIPR